MAYRPGEDMHYAPAKIIHKKDTTKIDVLTDVRIVSSRDDNNEPIVTISIRPHDNCIESFMKIKLVPSALLYNSNTLIDDIQNDATTEDGMISFRFYDNDAHTIIHWLELHSLIGLYIGTQNAIINLGYDYFYNYDYRYLDISHGDEGFTKEYLKFMNKTDRLKFDQKTGRFVKK